MQDVDLENLISSLNEGKCAAVIGPGFSLMGDAIDIGQEDSLHHMLHNQQNMQDTQYSLPDGFFYTDRTNRAEDIKMKNFILSQIKKFYAAKPLPAHFETLTAIPFNLVISLSPDDYLSRALVAKKIKHSFIYYKSGSGLYRRNFEYENVAQKYEAITAEQAMTNNGEMLILNLMGVYDDTQSLVATFDHFLEFMYNISPVDKKLPDHLHTVIQQASTFLFLGFGYSRWYLKIIFFILQKLIGSNKEKKAIINADDTADDNIKFYQNQFDLLFFKESTLQFLETIKGLCSPVVPANQVVGATALNEGYKIRMFSANPKGTSPMRLDSEYKNVEASYKNYGEGNAYDLSRVTAATRKEFIEIINRDFPSMIIISAHGLMNKTLLLEKDGDADEMSHTAIIDTIKTLSEKKKSKLKCILLACCHSDALAKELHENAGVDFVIGAEGPVNDDGISIFVNGFLFNVFNTSGELNYQEAFKDGIAAISGLSNNVAVLKCKETIKLYGGS